MPEYVSTRSTGEDAPLTYSDVVLEGIAPDGGLYIPKEYPSWSHEDLKALQGLTYEEIYLAVKSFFVGDSINTATQRQHAAAAYSPEKFPEAENGNIVPLRELDKNLFVVNLSLGPTGAFKDMALQPLGQEMDYELRRRGKRLLILGATSGDTGSAAEASVKGLDTIDLIMMSPEKGMSDFQQAQMDDLEGGNIENFAMQVPFDNLQKIVKEVSKELGLGAVNSINWGRVASQIAYYFSGYLQAIEASGKTIGDEVDFVVPTGNMGNALAAYLARKIGLPIRKIIIATNENSTTHELIQTGIYRKNDSRITTSPSMDIVVPSNYERVVHDQLGNDPDRTSSYYNQFEESGLVDFRDVGASSNLLTKAGFDSGASDHDKRIETIRWANERGTLIDPHTADAVWVARHQGGEEKALEVPTVCMETALWFKFEPTMEKAIGDLPERPERFRGLKNVPGGFKILSGMVELKEYIQEKQRNQL